jgi:hypothetical protein
MGKRENAFARFNELLKDSGDYTKQLPVGNGHKYAIYSDLHMADGGIRMNNANKFGVTKT